MNKTGGNEQSSDQSGGSSGGNSNSSGKLKSSEARTSRLAQVDSLLNSIMMIFLGMKSLME